MSVSISCVVCVCVGLKLCIGMFVQYMSGGILCVCLYMVVNVCMYVC